ncbi:MAG: hypothetical protein A2X22_07595 [Bacteroidetes bacterium GWF2_49_14]|nr:MAG: hypothetical protein A2X22_07595 [Bacteroidetes bacterium GWF2_49_14]HBB91180.1 hypothetical protein [Bacteroidales bacterium]
MRKLFLSIIFSFPILSVLAQVESPGSPWSLTTKLKSQSPVFQLDPLSDRQIKSYSGQFQDRLKSMLFAYPIMTSLTPMKDGVWEELPDGRRVWRLTISSSGARSLNIIFHRFHLPDGASMYLYTPGYKVVRGAFTRINELPSGVLATVPLPGDQLTVELNVSAGTAFDPHVIIGQVSHDFKGFFSETEIEKSGYCNVDINCPPGADWQIEKRAVVKFIRGGVWLCSGTLINTSQNSGRPLLLTANHCIALDWHAEQSVFYFRYEKPDCGTGAGSLQYSLSGSKLLATTSQIDFCLVELSSAPPKSYDPYYAGWDRRVVSYLDSVVCIHHPGGDVKKISKTYHRVVTGDFGGGFDANTHWKISQWDLGTTEPGSSGSGLFNTDHRLVGDLTGGDASCDYNFNDYFQKLSISWDRYPDSSNQLQCWLDPLKTGVMTMNGYDPYGGGKPLANFSIRPDLIQTGKKVYFTEKSTGLPATWAWNIPGGVPDHLSGDRPAPVVFPESGQYFASLTVANSMGRDSTRQSLRVFDYPDGNVSENRIVPGRTIELTDASTGSPLSVNWKIPNANPSIYAGAGPISLTLTDPGEYTTEQIVEFPEYSDTLVHYNRIKVLSDNIAFRSVTVTNIAKDDHTGFFTMGAQAYIPGSNSLGITAFADSFRNSGDTAYMITGITIHLERLSKWAGGYYLPVVVWNAQRQPVIRDSILLSDLRQDCRATIWLKSPVNFDTLNYVGFEIKPWDQGTFYSKMAIDRGSNGVNTAFAIKGNQWQPMTDVVGFHTSLDIGLETAYLKNSYAQEISILKSSNNGQFQVDLGKLVFKSVRVAVFSLTGQQLTTETEKTGNIIDLHIQAPVSGIYLVRLLIDDLPPFTQKVLIVKD